MRKHEPANTAVLMGIPYFISRRSSSSSSSAFPVRSLGFNIFGVQLLRMWPVFLFLFLFFVFWFFFNPAIEVITFRRRGWCILGVFLMPAFTCLGHECQNVLSPCDGMHVCID